MSLFSRPRRSGSSTARAEATGMEEQVIALRTALASCRALARRWKRTLTLAIGAIVVVLGVVLIVNREALQQTITDLIPALGIAEPVRGTDAAYAAYKSGDAETALQLARPLAEQGDANAQALLGLIFYNGRGVPKDELEATNWFRRAADQGNNTAQFHLGLMYSTGRGVPQNFFEGAKWYRLAADGGDAQAQFNLGVLYFNGEGVPESNVNAHMWFNLAAARLPAAGRHNRDSAARVRDVVAIKMTREQIAEAQKLARDWKPK